MPGILVTLLVTLSATTMPVRIDARGGILVPVRINGAGPFTFLLDTGTARSIVADTLVRELDAPVVARGEIVTSAGSEMGMVVSLASVALGQSRVDSLLAPVVDAPRLAQLGTGVRGILGQDFLSAFNYTLDYQRGRLSWDALVSCDDAAAIAAHRVEGRFVMTLADGDGEPLRLVPDSGAEVAVLFTASSIRSHGHARLVALTGQRTAAMTTIPLLRVGASALRNVAAVIVERHDPGVDGVLPLHRFASVSFAAGGACVIPLGVR